MNLSHNPKECTRWWVWMVVPTKKQEKGEDFLLLPLLLSLGAQPMDGASHNQGGSLLIS